MKKLLLILLLPLSLFAKCEVSNHFADGVPSLGYMLFIGEYCKNDVKHKNYLMLDIPQKIADRETFSQEYAIFGFPLGIKDVIKDIIKKQISDLPDAIYHIFTATHGNYDIEELFSVSNRYPFSDYFKRKDQLKNFDESMFLKQANNLTPLILKNNSKEEIFKKSFIGASPDGIAYYLFHITDKTFSNKELEGFLFNLDLVNIFTQCTLNNNRNISFNFPKYTDERLIQTDLGLDIPKQFCEYLHSIKDEILEDNVEKALNDTSKKNIHLRHTLQ